MSSSRPSVILGNVAFLTGGRREDPARLGVSAAPAGCRREPHRNAGSRRFSRSASSSFLYSDNPFYRFAEHLFVGASAAYLLAVQYQNVILPNVWMPLAWPHTPHSIDGH